MREFASVWKWTVEERKGIFTPSPERGTLKLNERPAPIPVKQHLLLIKVCVICITQQSVCTCVQWFFYGYIQYMYMYIRVYSMCFVYCCLFHRILIHFTVFI